MNLNEHEMRLMLDGNLAMAIVAYKRRTGCTMAEARSLYDSYRPTLNDHLTPPVGSWAYTARMMAELEPDFDWDRWKDEMKESDWDY